MVFTMLWLPVLFSLPGSLMAQDTLAVLAVLPLYYAVGVSLIHTFDDQGKHAWLGKWVGVVILAWTVDGLLQYVFGKDLFLIPLSLDGRIVGLFDTNLRLSLYLSVFLPMLLVWILGKNQVLAVMVFLVVATVVILSGARASWVMTAIVGFFLLRRVHFRYKWPVVAVSTMVMIAIAGSSRLVEEKLEQTVAIKHIDFGTVDELLGYRLTIWDTAVNMVKDRPLTGVGALAFDEAYDQYSRRPDDPFRTGGWYPGGVYHAHQLYVALAAETGLTGLLFFAAILAVTIKWYLSAPQQARIKAWPYAVGLVSDVFPLNSQPVLYKNWWFPVLLLLYCLLLTCVQYSPEKKTAAVGNDRLVR